MTTCSFGDEMPIYSELIGEDWLLPIFFGVIFVQFECI